MPVATVTATYSRRMQLRLDDGRYVEARIKGKKLRPVCGDFVDAEPIDNEGDWLIRTILERRNELSRPNLRGQAEVLAANIDTLVAVTAGSPDPDWFVVDRYLSAAEFMQANSIVVYNKVDVAPPGDRERRELATYRDIGYEALETSAKSGEGCDRLLEALATSTAIIVGQSGVGKSTIINWLSSGAQQRTGAISDKSGQGRHTTVNSVMLPLDGGGAVIDSPGVRDYAPAVAQSSDVSLGFREIQRLAADCRFANCRHFREPGCAVKSGVDEGTVSERRYESYRRLFTLTEKLSDPSR